MEKNICLCVNPVIFSLECLLLIGLLQDWLVTKMCSPRFQMCEVVSMVVKRDSASQPWGFSIDGGCGSEFFSGDTSIVVTGVAPHSPAASCLR